MPNPKRRHSKRRTSARRTHDSLRAPVLRRVPQLPRAQAAAPRVPALRTVQGPRSRSKSSKSNPLRPHSHADHCGGRNGRRSRPQSGSRRSDSGRALDLASARHPGRPGGRGPPGTATSTTAPADLPIEIHHASEVDHHGGQRRQGRAHQEGQLHSRGLAPGARRRGAGVGLGRQHRRRHGHRQDGAGHDAAAWTVRRSRRPFPR